MARGVNKVILIGNVGVAPEVRYMPNGNAIATLSLATSETWKDKNTGEKQEKTEWHRVVCFNRLGDIVNEYIRKGAKLYIEGSLRTRKWQDPQGQDRYTTEIVANELQMLDSKGSSPSHYEDVQQSQYASTSTPSSSSSSNHPNSQSITADTFEQLDDDVPF